MKSPLRKFRGFGLHHGRRERKDHCPPPAKLDELVYATQVYERRRPRQLSTAANSTAAVVIAGHATGDMVATEEAASSTAEEVAGDPN